MLARVSGNLEADSPSAKLMEQIESRLTREEKIDLIIKYSVGEGDKLCGILHRMGKLSKKGDLLTENSFDSQY
jgi:hypothetical protein